MKIVCCWEKINDVAKQEFRNEMDYFLCTYVFVAKRCVVLSNEKSAVVVLLIGGF